MSSYASRCCPASSIIPSPPVLHVKINFFFFSHLLPPPFIPLHPFPNALFLFSSLNCPILRPSPAFLLPLFSLSLSIHYFILSLCCLNFLPLFTIPLRPPPLLLPSFLFVFYTHTSCHPVTCSLYCLPFFPTLYLKRTV